MFLGDIDSRIQVLGCVSFEIANEEMAGDDNFELIICDGTVSEMLDGIHYAIALKEREYNVVILTGMPLDAIPQDIAAKVREREIPFFKKDRTGRDQLAAYVGKLLAS